MIKSVNSANEIGFLEPSPFSAVVLSLFSTYGTQADFVRFYVQPGSAAVSIVDGNVNIYANDTADFEEIAEFLSFSGYATIRADIDVINKLHLEIDDSSYIVRYLGKKSEKPENFVTEFDPHDIYKLLNSVGFAKGDYGAFASDVILRLNKGTAEFGGIAENGELLACCFKLFKSDMSTLLGALATSESARGRGLASSLVSYMSQSEEKSFLFCREDSLAKFYEKCGFTVCGQWAISVKK